PSRYSCSQECVLSKERAPQAKRESVKKMVEEHQLSERRVCVDSPVERRAHYNGRQAVVRNNT
ncbi:MAG: hypothetical protein ACKVOY_04710, partial [Burkholderiaceae bacterium]